MLASETPSRFFVRKTHFRENATFSSGRSAEANEPNENLSGGNVAADVHIRMRANASQSFHVQGMRDGAARGHPPVKYGSVIMHCELTAP